jgi:hypothetical protein
MAKSRIEGLSIKNTGIDSIIQSTEPDTLPELQKKKEETSRINFDVSASLKQRLQIYCVQNKTSIKDFITSIILERLNNDENK